jgi:acetate---CoA ligase (ADP-forming)
VPAAAGLRTGLRCAAAALHAAALHAGAGADAGRLRAIAAAARGATRAEGEWLPEHEAKELLRAAGVAVPYGLAVDGEDDAVAAWRELNGPVALKLSAARVQHKTELGGVALGLDSESDIRRAHREMAPLAGAHDGVFLVERMAPPGVELIVAAHTDGIVPALVIGLGGIWTELLGDVAVVPLPADAPRIERAIATLRGAPLLLGGRGRPGVDVTAAARLAEKVGALLLAQGLSAVECNPVLVGEPGQTHPGAVAVDAAVRTQGLA